MYVINEDKLFKNKWNSYIHTYIIYIYYKYNVKLVNIKFSPASLFWLKKQMKKKKKKKEKTTTEHWKLKNH